MYRLATPMVGLTLTVTAGFLAIRLSEPETTRPPHSEPRDPRTRIQEKQAPSRSLPEPTSAVEEASQALDTAPPRPTAGKTFTTRGRFARGSKRVLLTFDDGPHPVHTPRILAILARYRVKALFFSTGRQALRHPGILKRARAEGHGVGSHGHTHRDLTSLTRGGVEREVARSEAALVAAGLGRPRLFRPPYGRTDRRLVRLLSARGYEHNVLWTCDSKDWLLKRPRDIVNQVLRTVGSGGIILLHDIHARTVKALPPIIKGLRRKRLVLVADLADLARRESNRRNKARGSLGLSGRLERAAPAALRRP